jgi:NAD(P)-dependent dehydrogenase (short-subunit alcohol dehydrogenase family)
VNIYIKISVTDSKFNYKLNNMKILITGASRGIGLFLMQKFIEEKHEVFGTYNNTCLDEKLQERLTKVDVSDHNQIADWVNSVANSNDEIIVLNCAGGNYNSFAHKSDISKWKELIDINLIGTFSVINNVLPLMREKGFGRIINFSSIVAQKGIPGTSAYATSKSAMWGMTKSIAVENASKGITINSLNLGYFNIGMITDVPQVILDGIVKTIPARKLGDPENIFNAIQFLIKSDYITGTSLDINGGLY